MGVGVTQCAPVTNDIILVKSLLQIFIITWLHNSLYDIITYVRCMMRCMMRCMISSLDTCSLLFSVEWTKQINRGLFTAI